MVDLSKLESELAERKVEIRRLKQRGYERKYEAKNQKLKRRLTNANQEQAARKVENKKPRTVSYPTTEEVWGQREHAGSSRPLARPTAASRRTGIRSIIIQVD